MCTGMYTIYHMQVRMIERLMAELLCCPAAAHTRDTTQMCTGMYTIYHMQVRMTDSSNARAAVLPSSSLHMRHKSNLDL